MEQVLQIGAVCVLAAILALLVKKGSPETALLLTLAAAAAVFALLAGQLEEVLELMEDMAAAAGVEQALLAPLYKTIGIGFVVRIGGSLCRDAGESALAATVETAGTVCALLAAAPLLREVLVLLMELMNQ